MNLEAVLYQDAQETLGIQDERRSTRDKGKRIMLRQSNVPAVLWLTVNRWAVPSVRSVVYEIAVRIWIPKDFPAVSFIYGSKQPGNRYPTFGLPVVSFWK